MRTLPLHHPERRAVERALGLGRFRRVAWRAEGPVGACRATVARRIGQSGGEGVGGWLIHHWPGLFVEAPFHCFWRSPEGDVFDLTEKYPGDPARQTTAVLSDIPGFSVGPPSRHHPLCAAPEVRVLLALSRAQAEHRLALEGRVFARRGLRWPDGPLLGFATGEERAELNHHETLVGRAMAGCFSVGLGLKVGQKRPR
ncbi:MAG TPA: hypothetical protein VGO52_26390 [Hyphomonadaceae bacterium]|jgi:hypothetical protein|nr:hypothetical protein [Hyphomonadaceae bacterium]